MQNFGNISIRYLQQVSRGSSCYKKCPQRAARGDPACVEPGRCSLLGEYSSPLKWAKNRLCVRSIPEHHNSAFSEHRAPIHTTRKLASIGTVLGECRMCGAGFRGDE
ncbi:hypothetical protein GE061_014971 [Apolygus lucorum]|uniref:Uncharacterized protein n=1 Tax=Apolygus lucorum TaxID=248454 RepID=A0A8S9XMH0_APOLU|nr:hypothetical protein GE061_014971 [Apolygus lucorum]